MYTNGELSICCVCFWRKVSVIPIGVMLVTSKYTRSFTGLQTKDIDVSQYVERFCFIILKDIQRYENCRILSVSQCFIYFLAMTTFTVTRKHNKERMYTAYSFSHCVNH